MEIYSINTGFFKLDGGSMFGVVPKVLWNNKIRADENNRILMALRVLFVRSGNRKILIDTGIGNYHNEKFRSIFEITENVLEQELERLGESRDTITDVILTHLHFDHASGVAMKKHGSLVPAFPRAAHWIQKAHWLWAASPTAKDRASFLKPYLKVLEQSDLVLLVNGSVEVDKKITIFPVSGHTKAMQTVLIETEKQKHFYPADLIPTSFHVPIPYIMAYDNAPLKSLEEKMFYLNLAQKENWLVHYEHDPFIVAGTITIDNGKFLSVPQQMAKNRSF